MSLTTLFGRRASSSSTSSSSTKPKATIKALPTPSTITTDGDEGKMTESHIIDIIAGAPAAAEAVPSSSTTPSLASALSRPPSARSSSSPSPVPLPATAGADAITRLEEGHVPPPSSSSSSSSSSLVSALSRPPSRLSPFPMGQPSHREEDEDEDEDNGSSSSSSDDDDDDDSSDSSDDENEEEEEESGDDEAYSPLPPALLIPCRHSAAGAAAPGSTSRSSTLTQHHQHHHLHRHERPSCRTLRSSIRHASSHHSQHHHDEENDIIKSSYHTHNIHPPMGDGRTRTYSHTSSNGGGNSGSMSRNPSEGNVSTLGEITRHVSQSFQLSLEIVKNHLGEELVFCPICREYEGVSKTFKLSGCGHRYCPCCFASYLECKICEGQIYPTCFYSDEQGGEGGREGGCHPSSVREGRGGEGYPGACPGGDMGEI